ncbi:hypothetical protein NDU88_000990 [Pleurodeles waltl]|uniref:Uncharacterized protein n=1 Tax=Pleurodeles waltl TaxID=8319 RepID=A0AAV7SY07_PLEWA|nr:hypothetical protein NDU88_000990 [Pleurodeles waltl]
MCRVRIRSAARLRRFPCFQLFPLACGTVSTVPRRERNRIRRHRDGLVLSLPVAEEARSMDISFSAEAAGVSSWRLLSSDCVRCHGDGHEASRRQGKPRTVPQGAHAFSWNDAHSTVTRRPRSGREEKRSRKWLGRAQNRNPEAKSDREEERSRWLIAGPQGRQPPRQQQGTKKAVEKHPKDENTDKDAVGLDPRRQIEVIASHKPDSCVYNYKLGLRVPVSRVEPGTGGAARAPGEPKGSRQGALRRSTDRPCNCSYYAS